MRMRFASFFRLLILSGLACFWGCSGGEESTSDAEPGAASTAGETTDEPGSEPAEAVADDVKKVASKDLPPTEGFSPLVDKGRLQVPLLPKWSVPPRKSEWLFRLQRDRKTAYPQILVTVDEGFAPQEERLIKSNVAEFVPVWQKHLDKSHTAKAFGERVSPVRIGKRYAVECLLHSIAGKISLEQLQVTLIGAGRVYTFELRAQSGTLEEYRMDFYAVVAGCKIEAPATEPGGLTPMGETPEGETPAGAVPATTPAGEATPAAAVPAAETPPVAVPVKAQP